MNKISIVGIMVVVLGGVGCGSSEQPDNSESTETLTNNEPGVYGGAPTEEDPCSDLGKFECDENELCMQLVGQRVYRDLDGIGCLDYMEPVWACQPRRPCPDAPIFAGDDSGLLYRFPNGCFPESEYWEERPYEDLAECRSPSPPPADCSGLSLSECAETPGCNTFIYKVDESRQCEIPGMVWICAFPETICDYTYTTKYARDASGDLWRIPHGCVPDGFTEEFPEQQPNQCEPDL